MLAKNLTFLIPLFCFSFCLSPQRCSELIETTLLSRAQEWLSDPVKLRVMMSEDPAVIEERAHLKLVRTNIKAALEKLDVIIPGCIPKSPFTL